MQWSIQSIITHPDNFFIIIHKNSNKTPPQAANYHTSKPTNFSVLSFSLITFPTPYHGAILQFLYNFIPAYINKTVTVRLVGRVR